jgi:hypothetical protein
LSRAATSDDNAMVRQAAALALDRREHSPSVGSITHEVASPPRSREQQISLNEPLPSQIGAQQPRQSRSRRDGASRSSAVPSSGAPRRSASKIRPNLLLLGLGLLLVVYAIWRSLALFNSNALLAECSTSHALTVPRECPFTMTCDFPRRSSLICLSARNAEAQRIMMVYRREPHWKRNTASGSCRRPSTMLNAQAEMGG